MRDATRVIRSRSSHHQLVEPQLRKVSVRSKTSPPLPFLDEPLAGELELAGSLLGRSDMMSLAYKLRNGAGLSLVDMRLAVPLLATMFVVPIRETLWQLRLWC